MTETRATRLKSLPVAALAGWLLLLSPAVWANDGSASSAASGSPGSTAAAQSFEKAPLPMGQPMKGVTWTKVQDLNPDAKSTNRGFRQKWAVVIGASKFKEKRLEGEEIGMDKAAKEFYDYLVDEHGGRFQPDHVKLLINKDATRTNIMNALGENWLGSLAKPNDLVFVFCATNGFPTTDGGSYLCAYDCALDNVYSTCVSMKSLMDTIKHNVHSDRILLLLQACYSGAADLESGAKALYKNYSIDLDKVILGKGYMILSSSQPDQITTSAAFSHSLVKALREQDGLIDINQAFAKAKADTEALTLSTQGKRQTPVMKCDWKGNALVLGAPSIEQVAGLPAAVKNFLSAEACYLKATNAVNLGDAAEAEKEYQAALAIDPKYGDALADFGALKAIKGDWQGAADLYKKAIAANDNDSLYHANYARVLAQLGDHEGCLSELEKSYALNKKDKVVLVALSARLAKSDPDRSLNLIKEAVALFPNSAELHERLSLALVKTGALDQAVDEGRRAIELDSSSCSARMNLGTALFMQGDKPGAVDSYRAAVRLKPDNADAHFLLSKALEATGAAGEAKAELQTFLKLSPAADGRVEAARKHLGELSQAQ